MDRWESYFMDVAVRTSMLSYAERLKVGAVAVINKRVVCVGFNGTPPGYPNICEDSDGLTLSLVIHAEDNLIRFARERNISIVGCSLYITHSPCIRCAEKILGADIAEVIYLNEFRSTLGIEFLNKNNIATRKYNAS